MSAKCQRKGSRVKICAAPPTASSRRSPDPYNPHPSRFWPVPPLLVAYQVSSCLFLSVDKVTEPLPMMDIAGPRSRDKNRPRGHFIKAGKKTISEDEDDDEDEDEATYASEKYSGLH